MKYLGVDYGLKKIGLAIGDDETKFAAPLEVLENKEDADLTIQRMVSSERIDAIVIGMPQQEQGEITRIFIAKLKSLLKVPIHQVDEAFTSVESKRLQDETGSKVAEDALAAMLILQSYLDNHGVVGN